LASRTQESTANITSVIETLQLEVGLAVNNMEQCQERANSSVLCTTEAGALVQQMQTKMLEVTDLITVVSAATEEQSATNQQVKEIIIQITVLTEEKKQCVTYNSIE
jgi:methyl-accepting chemotaxis protein